MKLKIVLSIEVIFTFLLLIISLQNHYRCENILNNAQELLSYDLAKYGYITSTNATWCKENQIEITCFYNCEAKLGELQGYKVRKYYKILILNVEKYLEKDCYQIAGSLVL